MKWVPQFEPDEEQQLKTGYMSDNTTFMKWSTELEQKKDISDEAFFKRHYYEILGLNKFPALAFFDDKRNLQLYSLKMVNANLAFCAGQVDVCESTVLSAQTDVQLSRGMHGNYSKALITQRQEFREEKSEIGKKVGIFNKIFGGKKQEEEVPQQ